MVKIYDETATTFLNNGIATIQPYKCLVYKEDNGSYYVELESPIKDCDYLQQGNIVRVKTPWGWQGFRLGNPLKSSKRVKVKGKHLFYDSERYVIKSASVNNSLASTALTTLDDACDSSTPFIYTGTDITNKATLTVEKVTLQSGISSVIEMWGGHLVRDNWSIAVKATIGEDRGVTLAYGKNIKEIEAVENWDDVCTKIMPVGKDGVTIDEVFLENEQQHKIPYTKIVEFQQDLEKGEAETDEAFTARLKADLKTQAQAYLASHFEPQVNYTVKAHLNDVTDVGDTIRVKHPKCKIELVTSVIKVVYDAILKRYTSVEFGNYRPQLKDLISTVTKAATESAEKATAKVNERMTAALALATEKIYSYLKDSHIIYGENQILAVDKLPKEKAQKVMQISLGGIAFSKTGINGPFTSAWTLDGTLDMSAINVINLTADMIDVTDLKAFGATIGGWNIGDEAIYKEVTERKNNGTYKYCAYIQSPYAVGDDTWVYSTQVYEPGSDGYRGTFYVTIKGDMHVQRIDSDKTIYTNCAEDDSIYGAIEHRRGGYYGAFGVSKDEVGKWYGASIQCRNSNRITSRLDVREGEVDGLVILETYQEGTDNKNYRSYLSFGNGYLCAGEVKSGSVNLLNFQAKNGYFQTIDCQTIKTAGTGFAAIEHTRGSYMGSLGVGTAHDGEPSAALQLRNSSTVLARLDVCDTAYTGCVMLQTTANGDYSYLTFFPDVIVAGKADNYADTSAMLNFKANEIFATKVYQSSTESIKTNITAADSALGLFEPENSQIYSYNLKKTVTTPVEGGGDGDVSLDGEGFEITEEVEETTSYGFVIGDGYAVPEQVLNKDGNAINLYSMAALTWKAVQELHTKIKSLEENANAQ